jgi:glycine/D-amino acid oxidase-like deaminating enzyme
MKNINYWTENTPAPDDMPTQDLPIKADVTIVGSGYTGLNAAIELVKSGASVAVLDQETIGWGGSSRNGGLFAPDIAGGMQTIEKRYGKGMAKTFWQWSVDACSYVEKMASDEGIECDFHRNGQISLAYKPDHFTSAKRYTTYLAEEYGYTGQRAIEPAELNNEIGSRSYFGGILEEFAGGADPAKYVFGLAQTASRHGARLVENAKVTDIARNNGGFRLSSSKGIIESKEVLLATNGYTSHLIPKARYGIFPIASCIILTEPLSPELQRELSPNNRVFYDSKRLLNYFRLTADGRMLFGGRKSSSEDSNSDKSALRIHRRMLDVYPQLKDIPITHTWSGYIGYTFDKMPHIGRSNGIHYAYGYCGHGLATASYMGVEAAKLISGQQESSPFMEIPHPRYFFASFEKLFLPLGTIWYGLLDRYT